MKLFLLFLFSMTAFAIELEPLFINQESQEEILACYKKVKTKKFKKEILILKYNTELNDFFYRETLRGKIVVYSGSESTKQGYSRGISLSPMLEEGVDELPENGEDWTYPAPEDSVIAAKGNYKGFFLHQVEENQIRKFQGLYISKIHDTELVLDCTADIETVEEWIQSIEKYSPF